MKRIASLLALLSLSMIALPRSALAADVAFFPVESTSVSDTDRAAIGELLAQSYAAVSKQAVLAPSRVSTQAATYQEAAAQVGVAEYVRTDAVSVGQRIVIHSVRYQADGTMIYQAKMTAERADDLIAVSDRMARTLWERVDDEEVRTRKNVTLTEARPQTRTWSEKVTGFKTGMHFPFAKGADYSPSISLEFDMRFEAERYFLEFGGGILVPTRTAMYDYSCEYDEASGSCANDDEARIGGMTGEIGASYFLTDGNVAPYIGGGLIPRLVLSEGDDIAQMSPFVQIGLTLPRDSSTRFYIETRIAQGILEQRLDNDKAVHPTELAVHAGIGW